MVCALGCFGVELLERRLSGVALSLVPPRPPSRCERLFLITWMYRCSSSRSFPEPSSRGTACYAKAHCRWQIWPDRNGIVRPQRSLLCSSITSFWDLGRVLGHQQVTVAARVIVGRSGICVHICFRLTLPRGHDFFSLIGVGRSMGGHHGPELIAEYNLSR